jgi:hypothetical protein
MVDAIRVNLAAALASAGIPFSGIDVLFTAAVGLVLLVVAVATRVMVGRSRRPAWPRVVRPAQSARTETDVAASG